MKGLSTYQKWTLLLIHSSYQNFVQLYFVNKAKASWKRAIKKIFNLTLSTAPCISLVKDMKKVSGLFLISGQNYTLVLIPIMKFKIWNDIYSRFLASLVLKRMYGQNIILQEQTNIMYFSWNNWNMPVLWEIELLNVLRGPRQIVQKLKGKDC